MTDSEEKVIPVKVAVRSRPLLQWELDNGCSNCINFIKEAQQVIVNNKAFTYDYVFDSKISQDVVYSKAVSPLINGIFKGYNGTVLAYGQTGSGKTYTMGSAHCVSQVGVSDDITGIIPRVITDIFKGIEEKSNYEFLVKVSYVEIYKENLKDLLTLNSKNQNLMIRENTNGSIRIPGLTEAVVASVVDTLEYMERGNRNRSTGSTAMNATSSRSHAIFTIVLEARSLRSPDEITCSKFHLVDLAGSERVKRTKAEGDRFQEGVKINAGLLALGNVISALGDGHPGQHIPYRVSKLTRLLQDSLGGNSLTVMIACISPADANAEETTNTLRYADRARKIKNKAIVNRDPHTAELVSLRKEVQQLRLQLLKSNGTVTPVEVARDTPQTREQLRKLEDENRKLLQEMQKLVDTNTEICEKVVTTDIHIERLESKLMELQKDAKNVTDDPHDLSLLAEAVNDDNHSECVQKLRKLRSKVLEFKVTADETTEETVARLATTIPFEEKSNCIDDLNVSETEDDAAIKSEHILRTAKLSNQLQELTKALAMKEELAKRMGVSEENMVELRSQYEERLKKLDKELSELQTERDSLAAALKMAKKNDECQKLSEKRRVRLMELETQIKELKQEKKEKEKISKLKVQSDQKITKLHNEIQTMKSSRVKLMRQIKEENLKFQAWKKDKEKEVKQLKEKNRKRQYELVKLEQNFNNQKIVLRRKTEEAAASNRRLKEALMKQRMTIEKRMQSHSKILDSANSRMKAWMEEDIEIAVSAKQAKSHLASLEEELSSLNEQLRELESGESPNKRRRTFNVNDINENHRRELLNECELKEVQIKELQSKLSDAREARSRQQSRLLQITSIAEARSIMKHLFHLIVDSRLSEEACRKEATDLHNEVRLSQAEVHRLEKMNKETTLKRDEELARIQKSHQEEVLFLTRQLSEYSSNKQTKSSSEREEELKSQIRIQANLIQDLLKEKEEKSKVNPSEGSNAKKKNPTKAVAATKTILLEDLEEEEDIEIVSDYDSDYVPTPRFVRSKRRTTILKEKSNELQSIFCACTKTKCNTRLCKCKKAGVACGESCRCENCANASQLNVINSTGSSFNSLESHPINNTFVNASSFENKENDPTTPYYKRMPALLGENRDEQMEKPTQSQTRQSVYKPLYFNSPLSDRPSTQATVDGSASPIEKPEILKPKSNVSKKRRLNNNNSDLLL